MARSIRVLDQAHGENWTVYNGDSAEVLRGLPDRSIDIVVTSLPFSNVYCYSASERDLGNVRDDGQFFEHHGFITRELARVVKPGRLLCIHCMPLVTYESQHGVAGLVDFRGDIIRHYQSHGFIYHSEVTIQKNPQSQAIRNHPRGLLFVQLDRDASWMRQGLADYIVIMRAPGTNAVPVKPDVSHEEWIEWAHPVWHGIRETNVLPVIAAKDQEDERHLCPLQLEVIERCVRLWSNAGEVVLDMFSGIGSTGYMAVKLKRRYIGVELKPAYYRVSVENLKEAERSAKSGDLFAWAEAAAK